MTGPTSRRRDIATYCAVCGLDGWRSEFTWMAHEDICPSCMQAWVAQGWAVAERGALYALTPLGEVNLPGHVAVADCAWCATPVYRRWVDAGQAWLEPLPACRFCVETGEATRP